MPGPTAAVPLFLSPLGHKGAVAQWVGVEGLSLAVRAGCIPAGQVGFPMEA